MKKNQMKKRILIVLLISTTIFATCKKAIEEIPSALDVNMNSKNIEENIAGNFTLTITSTIDWTANCPDNWITLSTTGGKGNGTIKVDYLANQNPTERTGTITVKGNGVADKTITVKQKGLTDSQINIQDTNFVKGADISWLPQMEATGYKFYNDNGIEQECFQILKDHGINAIRLRTWVNPTNHKTSGHCSKEETVAMAIRVKKWGMKVMINFHYSDTWADPANQIKPAAWKDHSFPQLLNDVYNYTFDVMSALKTAGITPEWVQIGNEISPGMLLPDGSTASNWGQLAQLINKGYDAVKEVSPNSKVVLHIDQGNSNSRFRWWFDNATTNKMKYDVIGLSYYPYWISGHPDYSLSINDLGFNLLDIVSRYGKEVMIVEVGGEDTNPQNTYDMLVAVQNKVKAIPNKKGLGVMYWEPQGAKSWSGYSLSAWGSNGRPTKALDAFLIN